MSLSKYRHPFLFYFLATAIPWAFWFMAAYLSRLETTGKFIIYTSGILGLIGLISPMTIAFIIMYSDKDLKKDLTGRLFKLKAVKPVYIFLTCFLMLASILLAQAVSLLFGHDAGQFLFAESTSFTYGLFPAWFLLFLAPLFEELAWHSYGTDCLRSRFSLFTSSLIFGFYWALWHFPLSFIKNYYHSNVAESGALYSINFIVSLIPFVLLMNWLYYKTGRNILVAIVFHITAGFFNELFRTHPDSKVIQTGILLIVTVILLIKERKFFFSKDLSVLTA